MKVKDTHRAWIKVLNKIEQWDRSGAKIRFLEVEEDQHLHVESAHNHMPVVAKKKY